MGCPERVDIGFAVDVDYVDLTPLPPVHVLKVVDDTEHVDGVGHVIAVSEELDLSIDIVLDKPVDGCRPLDILREMFQRRLEMGLENTETVLDTGRLIEAVRQVVVGRRHRSTAGVADDDGGFESSCARWGTNDTETASPDAVGWIIRPKTTSILIVPARCCATYGPAAPASRSNRP